MPIISNANQDFSTYSVSSDDSSLDCFFTEIPERETLKGVYFQSVQHLSDSKASYVVDHTLQVLINVGGNRYTFPWSTLEQFPQSRLGRLRFCNTPEEIARLCDDYDETCQEYFFDRNPTAFRVILNFLAAGKLRLLRELCAVSLHDELDYWGVDPGHMERCCRRRMMTRVEEVVEQKRKEEEWKHKRIMLKNSITQSKKGYQRLISALREVMENPHSGLAGKMFAYLSVIMVLVTVVSLCISTMPDLRDEENRGECSQKCHNMFVVESICVAWFSLEFFLRFFNAQNKLDFAREPLNIIDAIAILPYYVSLVVEVGEESQEDVIVEAGRGYLDKLSLILRLLRALRILYVMRLARHSLGLQTLGVTMRRSMREFGLLLLFVCVAVALFSPLVHLAESELAPFASPYAHHSFSSIPASYWWAIISMTTVGYGDMVPHSITGQIVALMSILSGILIMAFPATSIFHTFSRSYQELKQEYERVWKQECHEEKGTRSKTGFSKEVENSLRKWRQWGKKRCFLSVNELAIKRADSPTDIRPSSQQKNTMKTLVTIGLLALVCFLCLISASLSGPQELMKDGCCQQHFQKKIPKNRVKHVAMTPKGCEPQAIM
ncbi:voltage-gated potassium channel regulatory subunit KCNG4-like [Xenentodon cancila]